MEVAKHHLKHMLSIGADFVDILRAVFGNELALKWEHMEGLDTDKGGIQRCGNGW